MEVSNEDAHQDQMVSASHCHIQALVFPAQGNYGPAQGTAAVSCRRQLDEAGTVQSAHPAYTLAGADQEY